MQPVVIIGSGLAGYTLAKEFRNYDNLTPLHIITSSSGEFYSKPLLSTALTQQKNKATLTIADAETMAQQLSAEIHTNSIVTKIDTINHTVIMDGKSLTYSKLVLAVGADNIKPALTGDGVQDVLSVNNLNDYDILQRKLADKTRLAILGAGLVGCEFANDFINVGHEVSVIAPCQYPLPSLLPNAVEAVAKVLQQSLALSGVEWFLPNTITTILKQGHSYLLTLADQQEIEVDVVLSAVGLRPHIALAQAAGIAVNRGIIINEYLQTNIADIYALGDCVEVNGLVLQYVAPLLQCAKALAKTLAGELTAVNFPVMPIVLKTPVCPIIILTPPSKMEGEWQISGENKDLKALFFNKEGQLAGFALTGKMVAERMNLTKQVSL